MLICMYVCVYVQAGGVAPTSFVFDFFIFSAPLLAEKSTSGIFTHFQYVYICMYCVSGLFMCVCICMRARFCTCMCVYFGVFIYLLCFCFADARQQRSSDLTIQVCMCDTLTCSCMCVYTLFVVFILIAFYLRCFR